MSQADPVLWARGLSLACSVSGCWEEGRSGGGGRCSGLKSAAPCSQELALVSLETTMRPSARSVLGGIGIGPLLHLKVWCLYLGLQILVSSYSGNLEKHLGC